MSTFIQLHLLTSYPPSNLNRDDTGRPKTAIMGGTQRLRISSQSLKRAWRTSALFDGIRGYLSKPENLAGYLGEKLAKEVKDRAQIEKTAPCIWQALTTTAGKKEKKAGDNEDEADAGDTDTALQFFSPQEIDSIIPKVVELWDKLVQSTPKIGGFSKKELKQLPDSFKQLKNDVVKTWKQSISPDIALFGRMLAGDKNLNIDAACQVAHAITVHPVAVEDDYFTAIDDLNKHEGEEGTGAAHIGETGFASGLFYIYVCIHRDQLLNNLSGNEELTKKTIRALTEAALTVSPTGKQNSFGSRAWASYVMGEKGSCQPRSLSVAYLKAIKHKDDYLQEATEAIKKIRTNMNEVYEMKTDSRELIPHLGEGNLEEFSKWILEA